MKIHKYISTCISIILSSCGMQDNKINTPSEAIKIADDYAKEHIAGYSKNKKIDAKLEGDNWIVNFKPLEGWTGGETSIVINKNTQKIVSAKATQ